MKKKFILLFLFALFSSSSFAQKQKFSTLDSLFDLLEIDPMRYFVKLFESFPLAASSFPMDLL